MERTEVLAVMREQAVELLGLDPDKVVESASFVDDLEVDSLSLVEYTMQLEDSFGIELPEEELTDLKDIGGLVTLVTQKTEAAGASAQ